MSNKTIQNKCERCGKTSTLQQKSFTISEHVSKYIKKKLQINNQPLDEKCKLNSYSCSYCKKDSEKNKIQLEEEKKRLEQEGENEEEIKLVKKKIEDINTFLKQKPTESSTKSIKRHQKWFYNEFSGEHLRKKIKNLDYLKLRKKETRSLLGEATKFILISKQRDKKFLVKYSKDCGERNDHGAKEIITEKIMTDIANYFMNSATCSLCLYKNRLALRSTIFTYFGKNSKYSYRAIHGKEIFKYSSIKSPPNKGKDQKEFYALEEIERSINEYPKQYKTLETEVAKKLILQFHLMLLVDAFLGNQDRHHENWCFILKGTKDQKIEQIYFSPLFDTGRGLFWNINLYELIHEYSRADKMENYVQGSSPLFHLKDKININHFDVIKYIKKRDPALFQGFRSKLRRLNLDDFFGSYNQLISPIRIVRMKKLLKIRRHKIMEV